jgi:lipopolysaccharide/colanic/teichoic acid biosynthesis glycosyltransferase
MALSIISNNNKKAKQRTSIVQAIKNREKNEFWCYKFRSMYIDNVDESQQEKGMIESLQ